MQLKHIVVGGAYIYRALLMVNQKWQYAFKGTEPKEHCIDSVKLRTLLLQSRLCDSRQVRPAAISPEIPHYFTGST
jgi:hypothetical protein